MRRLFIFFIGIVIISVFFLFFHKQPSLHVQHAQRISNEVGTYLSNKYNMNIIGTGGALFEQVNEIYLGFQIQGPLSKDLLRCIIVDCIEEFKNAFNSDEAVHPFLSNYPFTSKNFSVAIFILDHSGRRIKYPNIGVVASHRGNVEFDTFESDDVRKPYKTVENETYEEAKLLCEHTIQM